MAVGAVPNGRLGRVLRMRSGAHGPHLPLSFRHLASVLAVALAVLLPRLAFASPYGPSDNKAGNPPLYQNCTLCHLDYQVNSGDGDLQLLNLPSSYVPGNSYDLFVKIYDPGQSRWGFELTVMNALGQQ